MKSLETINEMITTNIAKFYFVISLFKSEYDLCVECVNNITQKLFKKCRLFVNIGHECIV